MLIKGIDFKLKEVSSQEIPFREDLIKLFAKMTKECEDLVISTRGVLSEGHPICFTASGDTFVPERYDADYDKILLDTYGTKDEEYYTAMPCLLRSLSDVKPTDSFDYVFYGGKSYRKGA